MNIAEMNVEKSTVQKTRHIAVVGGGVAGSTAAIHFAEQGFKVTLIEKGPSLVNGPPICHLHAGGNLYREISQAQCIDLLKQSIESVRLFPYSLNRRPTVIATPKSDGSNPSDLLPRLESIQSCYQTLVSADPRNKVLGDPEQYFKIYHKEELQALASEVQPHKPETMDEWIIPFCQHTDLDSLKYPVVMVQEYGWSVFRLASIAHLTLGQLPNCQILTSTRLKKSTQTEQGWLLVCDNASAEELVIEADFLVNACGFRTGEVDDSIGAKRQRLVEFKSAYVTEWQDCQQEWPEVIFHGPRGTSKGMAQLTPYGDGIFQLHGMTPDITLFEKGLVKSDSNSSQPQLPKDYLAKIDQGWPPEVLESRTRKAIGHMAQFVPSYQDAMPAGKALFGAQQIPGSDPTLRAADVTFEGERYARIEIVKASSTLIAAQKVLNQWFGHPISSEIEGQHPTALSLAANDVEAYAISLADERGYPRALAKVSGM